MHNRCGHWRRLRGAEVELGALYVIAHETKRDRENWLNGRVETLEARKGEAMTPGSQGVICP